MINRLIRNFTFDKDIREDLTFSDDTKIRLNTENEVGKLQLKLQENGEYPTDQDIYVETGLIEPNALQKWLKFEAIVTEDPDTHLLPSAFQVRFKVKTTAGNYYWDGSNWVTAGPANWNTQQEINAHLDTFPIATIGNKKIGFVVNLVTSDETRTPEVFEVKLLGLFDIEFFEDLVYDSLIRKLNTEFRSTSVLAFPTTVPISNLDLGSVLENKGYNITGIKKVINVTDDPLKLTNLFDSYAQGAAKQDGFTFEPGTVTFTSLIPASKLVEITFEYVPEIMVNTGVDYYETPSVPAIVFEDIEEMAIRGFKIKDTNNRERDHIRDKDNLTAVLELSPEQRDYRFNLAVFTGSQLDQMRLPEDLKRFFSRNKTIKSYGLDQDYDVNLPAEFSTKRNQKVDTGVDLNVATGAFDILGVLFFQRPSEDVPLIGNFDLNMEQQ